ncbi:GNAT family N-acetyltransferase [soil metagenome]
MATIRQAEAGDAAGVAEVHVAAWEAAYRGGLMPDAYLDALSVPARTATWSEALARPAGPGMARLVAMVGDRVVAFAIAGPQREDEEEGELYVLNVHPDAWGTGTGTALLRAATDALRDAGFAAAVLWVHPDNARARRFYEREGWRDDGASRVEDVLGVEVPEVRHRRTLD